MTASLRPGRLGVGWIDTLALAAIRGYQRHLSARKGYSCAYRSHTGCASCSTLGYRAIRRHGLWSGLALLDQRLARCAVAHRRFGQRPTPPSRQAGFCDVSFDLPCDAPCHLPCDNGAGDCVATALDGCSNVGGGDCDWRRRRNAMGEDQYVHIPVNTRPPR